MHEEQRIDAGPAEESRAARTDVQLRRVDGSRGERRWIRRLYRDAFPPEERPPFFLLRLRAKENVDWWRIEARGELCGFFYALTDRDLAYVFFLAIDAGARGQGVGTAALRELLRIYAGKRVFLAIEQLDPAAKNYGERVRRKQFYQRCGLEEMHKRMQEGGVVYELLGTGGSVSDAEYQALIRQWLPRPLAKLIPMRILE